MKKFRNTNNGWSEKLNQRFTRDSCTVLEAWIGRIFARRNRKWTKLNLLLGKTLSYSKTKILPLKFLAGAFFKIVSTKVNVSNWVKERSQNFWFYLWVKSIKNISFYSMDCDCFISTYDTGIKFQNVHVLQNLVWILHFNVKYRKKYWSFSHSLRKPDVWRFWYFFPGRFWKQKWRLSNSLTKIPVCVLLVSEVHST